MTASAQKAEIISGDFLCGIVALRIANMLMRRNYQAGMVFDDVYEARDKCPKR